MRHAFVPLTTATGMGPLPSVLEKMSGRRAVYRVFQETGIPLELVEQRDLKIPLAAMIALFNRAEKEAAMRLSGSGWDRR